MTLSCIVSRQEVVVAVALQCALYWTCYEAVTDANLEPPDLDTQLPRAGFDRA
jgi:hypothetical protein